MIKRPRYRKEFRDSVVLEITTGQSSVAQISKREHIAGQTLRNWINNASSGKTGSEQGEIMALKRQNEQLALALGEMAFEIHILKKFRKFLEQKQKSDISSGTLSPPRLVSSEDVQS